MSVKKDPKLELGNKYLERAKALGLDLANMTSVRLFLGTLRALKAKYENPKRINNRDLAEQLGVSESTIVLWLGNKRYVEMANEVLLADLLSDEARGDARHQMFYTYHTLLPEAVQNIAEIAAGKKANASNRDMILAYEALVNNSLGEAYLSSLFLGDASNSAEETHIAMRDSLRAKGQVLLLDGASMTDTPSKSLDEVQSANPPEVDPEDQLLEIVRNESPDQDQG